MIFPARATAGLSCVAMVAALWACAADKEVAGVSDLLPAEPPAAATASCTRAADYLANPPRRLSELCLLENHNGTIVPSADVVPYDVNAPLFSDYALKARMIWVPRGASIRYDAAAALDMPVGSLVAKTFAFAKDYRSPAEEVRVLETRVLMRTQAGWVGLPYVWSDAQDDAILSTAGATRAIDFIDAQGAARSASYLLPSNFDCHSCHDSSDGVPQLIGVSARQLNRDFAYADGTENQLAHLVRLGILTAAPDPTEAPRLAAWNDPATGSVAERARAYLEGNCAHCHDAAGLAQKTALFLRADEKDPARFGACRVTGAAATGGFKYDVVPGDPDHSVIAFRLASTDPHVMMPQIGRSVVHTEGLALVRAWIGGLPGSCDANDAGAPDASGDASDDGGAEAAADAGPPPAQDANGG